MTIVFSTDEHSYKFSTEHEAIEDIIDGSFGDVAEGSVITFWRGETEEVDPKPSANWLIEEMCEIAHGQAGEFSEDWLLDVTSEQTADLQSGLNSLVENWLNAHSLNPTFYLVKNAKQVRARITELTDTDFKYEVINEPDAL